MPHDHATQGQASMSTHHEEPTDPRKYRQLAAALRTQITSGEIAPGDPAPTITELAASHQCARQTCAKALSILAGEGLVTRYPGLGYYVATTRVKSN
jgi:DNA-binding GntR family transcriptional regulator